MVNERLCEYVAFELEHKNIDITLMFLLAVPTQTQDMHMLLVKFYDGIML